MMNADLEKGGRGDGGDAARLPHRKRIGEPLAGDLSFCDTRARVHKRAWSKAHHTWPARTACRTLPGAHLRRDEDAANGDYGISRADLHRSRRPGGPYAARYGANIASAAKRLDSIVQEMVDVSSIDQRILKMEEMYPNRLIEASVNELSFCFSLGNRRYQPGRVDPGLQWGHAEAHAAFVQGTRQCHQVHLRRRAHHHRRLCLAEGRLHGCRAQVPSNFWKLPSPIRSSVWMPMTKSRSSTRGAGLGLSIAKGIADCTAASSG